MISTAILRVVSALEVETNPNHHTRPHRHKPRLIFNGIFSAPPAPSRHSRPEQDQECTVGRSQDQRSTPDPPARIRAEIGRQRDRCCHGCKHSRRPLITFLFSTNVRIFRTFMAAAKLFSGLSSAGRGDSAGAIMPPPRRDVRQKVSIFRLCPSRRIAHLLQPVIICRQYGCDLRRNSALGAQAPD